jgi:hypothetical protein
MGITAEVVRAITAPLTILEIIATDTPNTLIVAVTIKKRLTIKKEIRMRYAVILEDNSFRFLIKKPADCLANTLTASKVAVAVEVLDLARPINFAPNNLPGCQDLLILSRPAGVGAVAGDVNPLWRVRPYGLDNLPCGARTAPGQEQNRGLHAGNTTD